MLGVQACVFADRPQTNLGALVGGILGTEASPGSKFSESALLRAFSANRIIVPFPCRHRSTETSSDGGDSGSWLVLVSKHGPTGTSPARGHFTHRRKAAKETAETEGEAEQAGIGGGDSGRVAQAY